MSQEKRENFFTELLKFALIAIVIVLPIRLFVAQPFIVSGASMVPTFYNGQYLIVDELSYRFEDPKRSEVIIFRYPKDPYSFLSNASSDSQEKQSYCPPVLFRYKKQTARPCYSTSNT
jgi:signal peptidase I